MIAFVEQCSTRLTSICAFTIGNLFQTSINNACLDVLMCAETVDSCIQPMCIWWVTEE